MRKLATLSTCVVLMMSIGCGNGLEINGSYHDTYGLLSLDKKDPEVCYKAIFGNIVLAVILVEAIIPTIYFVGWSIFEPVPVLDDNGQQNCPYGT